MGEEGKDFTIDWLSTSAGVACACGRGLTFDHESEPKECPCGRRYSLVAYITCDIKSLHLDEYMGEDKLWPDGSIGPETAES